MVKPVSGQVSAVSVPVRVFVHHREVTVVTMAAWSTPACLTCHWLVRLGHSAEIVIPPAVTISLYKVGLLQFAHNSGPVVGLQEGHVVGRK